MADAFDWLPSEYRPRTPASPPVPWVQRLSDDDLALLGAVLQLSPNGAAPWAGDLIAGLRERGEAAPERPAPARAAPASEPDDFGTILAREWPRATPRMRDALRTVAAALGVDTPPEPIEPEPATPTPAPAPEPSAPEPIDPAPEAVEPAPDAESESEPEPAPTPERDADPMSDDEWRMGKPFGSLGYPGRATGSRFLV